MDASEGVAAQTVANFWLAFELGLPLLPVLNKIGTIGPSDGKRRHIDDLSKLTEVFLSFVMGKGEESMIFVKVDRS